MRFSKSEVNICLSWTNTDCLNDGFRYDKRIAFRVFIDMMVSETDAECLKH